MAAQIPLITTTKSLSSTFLSHFQVFVTDFDETLTDKDSLSTLASLSPIYQNNSSSSPLPPAWSYFSNLYFQLLKQCQESANPPIAYLNASCTDSSAISCGLTSFQIAQAYSDYLDQMRYADTESTRQVMEYGILKGIRDEEIRSVGEKNLITLRSNAPLVISNWITAKQQRDSCEKDSSSTAPSFYISSLNWSAEMIRGVIKEKLQHWKDAVVVLANDLEMVEEVVVDDDDNVMTVNVTNGRLVERQITGGDKWKATMARLDKDWASNRSIIHHNVSSGNRVIYLGDSTSDLPLLVWAELGILLKKTPSPSFESLTRQLGIHLQSLPLNWSELSDQLQIPKTIFYGDWTDLHKLMRT